MPPPKAARCSAIKNLLLYKIELYSRHRIQITRSLSKGWPPAPDKARQQAPDSLNRACFFHGSKRAGSLPPLPASSLASGFDATSPIAIQMHQLHSKCKTDMQPETGGSSDSSVDAVDLPVGKNGTRSRFH